MGLTFRLESLATALFERVIDDEELGDIDRARLSDVSSWIHKVTANGVQVRLLFSRLPVARNGP